MISKKIRKELENIGDVIGHSLLDNLSENMLETGSIVETLDEADRAKAYDIIWVRAIKFIKGFG